MYRRCPLGGGHDSTIGALYIYVKRGILTLRNATSALEKLIKDQANDMVWTEEELDHLALLEVRAEQKAIAKGHKKAAIGIEEIKKNYGENFKEDNAKFRISFPELEK